MDAKREPVSGSGSDAGAIPQEKPHLPPNGQVIEGLPDVAEKKSDSSVKFFLVSGPLVIMMFKY